MNHQECLPGCFRSHLKSHEFFLHELLIVHQTSIKNMIRKELDVHSLGRNQVPYNRNISRKSELLCFSVSRFSMLLNLHRRIYNDRVTLPDDLSRYYRATTPNLFQKEDLLVSVEQLQSDFLTCVGLFLYVFTLFG